MLMRMQRSWQPLWRFGGLILALVSLFLSPGHAKATSFAALVSLSGPLSQGSLIIGTAPAGSQVRKDGQDLMMTPDGMFVFGFHRDHPDSTRLTLITPDNQLYTETMPVAARTYKVQHIDGLPPKSVTPPQDVLDRIRAEATRVRAAREAASPEPLFQGKTWQWPSPGQITGVYGSQRVLNGEPRRPHFGIDIAAPTGTPVVAPMTGIITFAEPDLYYSGGTLIMDHGLGVSSTFLHMARIDVVVGQRVQQGEKIGTVGSTGRSTGPHLDWRINWFQERLDPAFLVSPAPEPI